jgi:hypothetical protein
MWSLSRLAVDDYRLHLNLAFPAGTLPELVSEADKDAIVHLYALYEEKRGRPSGELLGELSVDVRNAVHDAYRFVQDGRRLGDLRAQLKLLAQVCPYCGFGQVDELDHLLQRGYFHLFSIFPLNLVPCCGVCNRGKRKVPSANASEHQVHVYLENVTGLDFLRAEATIAGSGALVVKYTVEWCEGMNGDLLARLKHHLTEFDLHTRYQRQVNIYLGELEYTHCNRLRLASGKARTPSLFCRTRPTNSRSPE